jgi:hypothetical protein
MYLHVFLYQIWEKNLEINQNNQYQIISIFFKIFLLNDIFYVIAKKLSTTIPPNSTRFIGNCIVAMGILQFLISAFIFLPITIETYYKTFRTMQYLWIFMNCVKTTLTLTKIKFYSDLIKLVDTIWLVNILLIVLTDPIQNSTEKPNLVTFYEIYFRYMEFHILILACTLIYNDRNIEEDVQSQIYTTSTILGKFDSFRFSVILILGHYYFVLVNSLAFSFKYIFYLF